ncbi:hypothetical protein ZYGR_0S01970 [Zygosaccharomyces rouxii]|uniref:ZYRO0F06908p n=2 Tax=Zygosaccharomyces rouxii TaxID=4956 RepID=C5DXQ3_ZYGRC|nr:uncharacterized protein ZYRO0F06908g [Zygosaccharomyces rouxii]KAH9199323.1 hypothetical protein LQ764DRAFT_235163 [Zygosaccharomyces rouxii]GAV50063.1 hypothetical protein ZYGR_0S01970 [Zygosaccharomyces rouxii]CAR28564.1 ZYRO0F06908p [Zygosaccharomyces rouxii]
MQTKTVSHTIETPLEPIQLLATLPVNDSKKTPISITISGSAGLACYHYAIPYRDDVVGSLMVDDANDSKRDITRQLATLVAKKYQRPCYVAYACNNTEDQLLIIRQCIEFLKLNI